MEKCSVGVPESVYFGVFFITDFLLMVVLCRV